MSDRSKILILVATIAFAAVLGAGTYRYYLRYPTTDDAYVKADIVAIVARVSGPIVHLPIEDNQAVRAGDLLFEIDPRPYSIAVEKARAQVDATGQNLSALADAVTSSEAQLAEAQAQLRLALAQYNRIQPLIAVGAVPYQDKDKADAGLAEARSKVDDARARLSQALHELGEADEGNPEMRTVIAALEQAELELSWTKVFAPINGYVTDLRQSLGSYANTGSPMLALVNTDSWRVEGYYKETQLERIRPGMPATVYLLGYPGDPREAAVQGIAWGVEQQNREGAPGPSGIPVVTPTVDWVRMAQRFPVRITLSDSDATRPLRTGMRATVRIDTTSSPDGG